MVTVGTSQNGGRFMKRKWPITKGLIAGSTTQEGNISNLEFQEDATDYRGAP